MLRFVMKYTVLLTKHDAVCMVFMGHATVATLAKVCSEDSVQFKLVNRDVCLLV